MPLKRKDASRRRAIEIARIALDKKASSVVVLDMSGLVYFTDYFVICSADNVTHAGALVDHIEQGMKTAHRLRPIGIEGRQHAHWVLIDYGDVVVHVFDRETREHYELEKLWLDAPEVAVEEAKDKAAVGGKDTGGVSEKRH